METLALGQVFASAVRYIQDHSGIDTPPYFGEAPEGFIVPSMYFPVPRVRGKKVTLASYRLRITMECWFLAMDEWEAHRYASGVQLCLLRDRCSIPVMGEDGSAEGWSVHITEPELQKSSNRSVRLSFELQHYMSFPGKGAERANHIKILFTDPAEVQQAWAVATAKQGKEEEVQKAWLKKIAKSL